MATYPANVVPLHGDRYLTEGEDSSVASYEDYPQDESPFTVSFNPKSYLDELETSRKLRYIWRSHHERSLEIPFPIQFSEEREFRYLLPISDSISHYLDPKLAIYAHLKQLKIAPIGTFGMWNIIAEQRRLLNTSLTYDSDYPSKLALQSDQSDDAMYSNSMGGQTEDRAAAENNRANNIGKFVVILFNSLLGSAPFMAIGVAFFSAFLGAALFTTGHFLMVIPCMLAFLGSVVVAPLLFKMKELCDQQ